MNIFGGVSAAFYYYYFSKTLPDLSPRISVFAAQNLKRAIPTFFPPCFHPKSGTFLRKTWKSQTLNFTGGATRAPCVKMVKRDVNVQLVQESV